MNWPKTNFNATTNINRKEAVVYDFVAENTGVDLFTTFHQHTLDMSILEAAVEVKAIFQSLGITSNLRSDEGNYISVMSEKIMALLFKSGESGPASYDDESPEGSILRKTIQEVTITLVANKELTEQISKMLKEVFQKIRYSAIKWWYVGPHGAGQRTVYMDDPKTIILPEFYPDMNDPEKFIGDYLASTATVLLLAGPPGTGKTTLLRHMIYHRNMKATVIYDESLMQKDTIFQDFLFSDQDIMVIEDADVILMDRENAANPLMSRFLSVSDGLIKLPSKKMVFTTNLNDFQKVDSALLRPGRCFGMVQMRQLDLNEAVAAAKAAGLQIPTEKRQYSLAELFNRGQGAEVRRMGLIAA